MQKQSEKCEGWYVGCRDILNIVTAAAGYTVHSRNMPLLAILPISSILIWLLWLYWSCYLEVSKLNDSVANAMKLTFNPHAQNITIHCDGDGICYCDDCDLLSIYWLSITHCYSCWCYSCWYWRLRYHLIWLMMQSWRWCSRADGDVSMLWHIETFCCYSLLTVIHSPITFSEWLICSDSLRDLFSLYGMLLHCLHSDAIYSYDDDTNCHSNVPIHLCIGTFCLGSLSIFWLILLLWLLSVVFWPDKWRILIPNAMMMTGWPTWLSPGGYWPADQ